MERVCKQQKKRHYRGREFFFRLPMSILSLQFKMTEKKLRDKNEGENVCTHFCNCYSFQANLLSRDNPKRFGSRSGSTTTYLSWTIPGDIERISAKSLRKLVGWMENAVNNGTKSLFNLFLTFSNRSNPLATLFICRCDEIKRECRQRTVSSCYAIQFWVSNLKRIALKMNVIEIIDNY